jgi:F-type H+-transporting ATPase subunit gamma
MAENLPVLKKRIKAAGSIAQIAKAMEMIAASKIKRAQDAVANNRPYATTIIDLVQDILCDPDIASFSHPYLQPSASEKKLLIAISPEKGLCGALPTNVQKAFYSAVDKNTFVVTVGKKVEGFAARIGAELVASFPMKTSLPAYAVIFPILEIVKEYYEGGKVSSVSVLHAEYRAIPPQPIVVKNLLPIVPSVEPKTQRTIPFVFEPGMETILKELLPYYVEVELYNYLIQAYTSEQLSRMVAMQNAKSNALDVVDSLTLAYNKSRQEKITNELLDLANGQAKR